jgi:hypothetical protein
MAVVVKWNDTSICHLFFKVKYFFERASSKLVTFQREETSNWPFHIRLTSGEFKPKCHQKNKNKTKQNKKNK